jgi:PleD family two-component response regulator
MCTSECTDTHRDCAFIIRIAAIEISEVCAALDVPIAMITSRQTDEVKMEALEAGATDSCPSGRRASR